MENGKFATDEAAVLAELLRKVDRQTDLILELKEQLNFLQENTPVLTKEAKRKDLFQSRKGFDYKPSKQVI